MDAIEAPEFNATIVAFIEPLTAWTQGVKLRLAYNEIEFTCNFDYPPFLGGCEFMNRRRYKEIFPIGHRIKATAYLYDHSADHLMLPANQTEPLRVTEYGMLDWEVVGRVMSEPENGEVLIDCGFPLVAFCPRSAPVGAVALWRGELIIYGELL